MFKVETIRGAIVTFCHLCPQACSMAIMYEVDTSWEVIVTPSSLSYRHPYLQACYMAMFKEDTI